MMGLGQLGDMLARLMALAGVHLPSWGVPVGIVALLVLLIPFRLRGERANRALRLLAKASTASSVRERDTLEAEALAEVGDDAHGLLVVAKWAVERGRWPLAERVLHAPIVARNPEALRLRRSMEGANRLDADAIAAKVLGLPISEVGHRREHADEEP